MTQAKPLNRHQQWVRAYREERQRCEIEAENVSLGYGTEYAEYIKDHPLPTLKEWMKHREKAPDVAEQAYRKGDKVWHHGRQQEYEVALDGVQRGRVKIQDGKRQYSVNAKDIERRTWTEEDRPVETARVTEMQELDRAFEAAAEKVEMQRYLGVDTEPPTVQEIRDYNETGLLGAAMVSDEALPALRTVRNEFSDQFHANVGKAILDQAADGAPHDAEAVTAVLREREQLVLEHDPALPMRTVDPAEYGLATWAKGANPADANALAQEIRQYHRTDYLAGVGERLQQSALAAAEAGEDPGLAFARSANELVAVPARLDLDLREVRNTASLEAVDTRKPARVVTARSEATTVNLGLPARPSTPNLRALASA